MKEQELRPPGLIEGLGIKSALWFEGKLDEWSQPPTIKYISERRSKKWPISIAGITAVGLVLLAGYYNENQRLTPASLSRPPQPVPDFTRLVPRPVEVRTGEVEVFLRDRQTVVSFRGGMVLNYVEEVQMSMVPFSLERLSLDPRVGINLPPNRQSFAFVLPIIEIEKPAFKRMMEDESEKRLLLAEYDRQQNLRAQGIKSGRLHNVAIPFYEILKRVYQNQPNQDMSIRCFYRLVEIEMALSWADGMRMVAIDQPDLPILRRTLSVDAINIIGNFRPQPFRVYSIEPNLIEEALGLSYGTLKISDSCG